MKRFIFTLVMIIIFYYPASNFIYAQGTDNNWMSRGKEYMINGEYKKAAGIFNKAVAADSNNTEALYYLSSVYRSLYNFQSAIPPLKMAVMLKPGNASYAVALGQCYQSSGDIYGAKDAFLNALKIDSLNTEALLGLGKIDMSLKDYHSCRDIYTTLLAGDSTNSYFYKQLGTCEIPLGLIEEAIIHLQTAFNMNPKNIDVALMLSSLYYGTEKTLSALRVIDKSLSLIDNSPALWKRKGEIEFKLKEYRVSVDCYLSSIALNDTVASNFRNTGIAYYLLSENDSAEVMLRRATEIDEKDAGAYFYLGVVLKQLERYDEAIESFNAALDLMKNKTIGEAYVQLADAYQQKNDYPETIKYYHEALHENPDNYASYFRLGVAYDKYYEDKNVALLYYKKYLRESKKEDTSVVSYAEDRINKLIEEIHFQK